MSAKQCQISTPLIVFFLESFPFLRSTLIYFACLAIIRAEGWGIARILEGMSMDLRLPHGGWSSEAGLKIYASASFGQRMSVTLRM